MATFNININAEPSFPYAASNESFRRNDCVVLNEDIPIGIINTINVNGVLFLLNEYLAANNWKFLFMYNPSYSSPSSMYFEFNNTNLTEDADPNVIKASVNVEAVTANQAVPFFFLKFDNHTVTGNEFAIMDIEIEDVLSTKLGRITIGFYLIKEDCPPVIPKAITTDSEVVNSCSTTRVVTVNVPSESSRYVLGVTIDGFGSITGGTLPETITASKSYTLKIDADNSGSVNTYSRVELSVKQSSTSGTTLGSSYISRNHTGNIC